jgi:hypothetical protein
VSVLARPSYKELLAQMPTLAAHEYDALE